MSNKNVLIIHQNENAHAARVGVLKQRLRVSFTIKEASTFITKANHAYGEKPDAVVVLDFENAHTLQSTLVSIRKACPNAAIAVMSNQPVTQWANFEALRVEAVGVSITNFDLIPGAIVRGLQK